MTWAAIITALLQIFGPFLSDLLKKLMDKWFNKAKTSLSAVDPSTLSPDEAVDKLFGEVETNLPKVAPARRLMLKAMRRMALKHSAAIVKGDAVALDAHDVSELSLYGKLI